MSEARLLRGAVEAILPGLSPESFDACLCDPPYEYGFMGKSWDRTGIAFRPATWAAILRVLKPGAFMLAFGGTRTYHRLACAIEGAGFEIRDSVLVPGAAWIHSQGFPKSLQFGCSCLPDMAQYESDSREMASDGLPHLWSGLPEANVLDQEDGGALLLPALRGTAQGPGVGAPRTQGPRCVDSGQSDQLPLQDDGLAEPGLEGRGHPQEAEGELSGPQVCALPSGAPVNGASRRLRNGASADHGTDARSRPDSRGGGASQEPRSTRQRGGKPRTLADESRPQAGRGGQVCPRCGKPVGWRNYGTALKPAWEPVVVAMKPLAGTFAENALRHGVAGLNIEGSRIGTSKEVPASPATRNGFGFAPNDERSGAKGMDPGVGRWPANVILVHHPECVLEGDEVHEARLGFEPSTRSPTIATRRLEPGCHADCPVAELDRQSGVLASGDVWAGSPKKGTGYRGGFGREERNDSPGDTGGASRFFYCAKVSAAERNGSRHPTLKPVDLCAYLAKLILPPARSGAPRRLLVPFSGAGSEIIGALRVGWEEVVGIEQDAESVADAQRRIEADAPLFNAVQAPEPRPAGDRAP